MTAKRPKPHLVRVFRDGLDHGYQPPRPGGISNIDALAWDAALIEIECRVEVNVCWSESQPSGAMNVDVYLDGYCAEARRFPEAEQYLAGILAGARAAENRRVSIEKRKRLVLIDALGATVCDRCQAIVDDIDKHIDWHVDVIEEF